MFTLIGFEKIILIILLSTCILCCWGRRPSGTRIYLFIHLIFSSILIAYWASAEIAFYFSVMNIISFILIFLYDYQFLKTPKNRKNLRKYFFPLISILTSVCFGVFISIRDQGVQSFSKFSVEVQFLNKYWEEYLAILAFTGLILTCFIVRQKNKLEE